MKQFNEKIKELRTRGPQKINQSTIAKAIGVDRTTYSKYETGDSEPDFNTVNKIADFFGVSIDYLLGRDEKNDEESYQKANANSNIVLSEIEIKKIKEESERLRSMIISSIGFAYDGEIEDENTLEKVMLAMEEGLVLAKKEAKAKYTPKKYRKQ